MPQIPQSLLDCSIYLYESREDAEDGVNSGGSGCLVEIGRNPFYDPASLEVGRHYKVFMFFPSHIYAVTNRHLIEQGFTVIRLNTIDGKSDILVLNRRDWILHPDGDDLAVAYVELPKGKYSYYAVDVEWFVHSLGLNDRDLPIGAGDDTFMVGRLISHAGKQRNTPSLRFGNIAMLPFEKIKLKGGHRQEAFLVETRSISGFSGSPVFVYRPAGKTAITPPDLGSSDYAAVAEHMQYPYLLGIDCGHVLDRQQMFTADGKPLDLKVESNTGMAIVIPAWRLVGLLNTEELVEEREQKSKQYLEEQEQEEAARRRSSVAFDVKKPDSREECYRDVLERAARKISSPDEEKDGA